MILHCSYEELTAIDTAIDRVFEALDNGGVAAPPEVLPALEALSPRLTGDLSVDSLEEANQIQRALEFLLVDARERVDDFILRENPSSESAIRAFFEYAHVLTVLDRLRHISDEMRALIDLMTGGAPTDEAARRFSFDDD